MQIMTDMTVALTNGELAGLTAAACLGCETCEGLCDALIQAFTVPAIVLREARQ